MNLLQYIEKLPMMTLKSFTRSHHYGHYKWATSKVAIKTKQKNFIELFYDLTYSLPNALHHNHKCEEYETNSFDYCVNEVY